MDVEAGIGTVSISVLDIAESPRDCASPRSIPSVVVTKSREIKDGCESEGARCRNPRSW